MSDPLNGALLSTHTSSQPTATDEAADNLIAFIKLLQAIDGSATLATLNETSMPDNNGSRIQF